MKIKKFGAPNDHLSEVGVIDISWPVSPQMTAYKDKKVVAFEQTKIFERDHARESRMMLGAHSGTHIDAPAHFLENGVTIDQLPLTAFNGPCRVLDLSVVAEYISAEDLIPYKINPGEIILLKTSNSSASPLQPFNPNFIYLSASAAQHLADAQIKAVGIDYLGIERNQPDHATHTTLMQYNVVIIEGLRLAQVPEGRYQLVCLPLAVVGLEAAPARAVLIA